MTSTATEVRMKQAEFERRISELEAALRTVWACLDDNTCDEINGDGTTYQSADLAAARREIDRLMPELSIR